MDLEQAIAILSAHECVLYYVADPNKYVPPTLKTWQVFFIGDEDGIKGVSEGLSWQEAVTKAKDRGFTPQ